MPWAKHHRKERFAELDKRRLKNNEQKTEHRNNK
jgi:hypothetical protein